MAVPPGEARAAYIMHCRRRDACPLHLRDDDPAGEALAPEAFSRMAGAKSVTTWKNASGDRRKPIRHAPRSRCSIAKITRRDSLLRRSFCLRRILRRKPAFRSAPGMGREVGGLSSDDRVVAIRRPARLVDEPPQPSATGAAVIPAIPQQLADLAISHDWIERGGSASRGAMTWFVAIQLGHERAEHLVPDG